MVKSGKFVQGRCMQKASEMRARGCFGSSLFMNISPLCSNWGTIPLPELPFLTIPAMLRRIE
jgi:hypothetical protein